MIVSGSYQVVAYALETGARTWWVDGMAWQAKSVPVIDEDLLFVHSWMASPDEIGVRTITMPWDEALASYDGNDDRALSKDEVQTELGLDEIWFLYDLDQDGALSEDDWRFALARAQAQNGLYAIQLGGIGNVSQTHIRWRHQKSLPNIPSPLVYRGLVYVLKEGGVLSALDATTGEPAKVGRVTGAEDPYFASPIASGGRLVTASKDGHVATLRVGRDWEVLSVNAFRKKSGRLPRLETGASTLGLNEHCTLFRRPRRIDRRKLPAEVTVMSGKRLTSLADAKHVRQKCFLDSVIRLIRPEVQCTQESGKTVIG